MGRTRFHKHIREGVYIRHVELSDSGIIELRIPIDTWNRKISLAVNKWIQRHKNIKSVDIECDMFRWGTIKIFTPDNICHICQDMSHICNKCGILYKSRSGLYRHMRNCDKERSIVINGVFNDINVRGKVSQNVSVSNIQINNTIQIRNIGEENPDWLTSQILYQVIGDVEKVIPKLMEKKHFNDEFPENKNIRVNNLRDMNKFLQVFENGRWRVKDSKHTFYRVITEIYDVLSEALTDEPDESDEDEDEDENKDSINEVARTSRRSERFISKVNKIRPMWEEFQDKIQSLDPEIMEELWKDLKMLLMDRQLAIEQGLE